MKMKLIVLKDCQYGHERRILCKPLSSSSNSNISLESVCFLNDNNQRLRLMRTCNDEYSVAFQTDNDLKINKKGKGTAFFLMKVINDNNNCDNDTCYCIKSCDEYDGSNVYIGFNEQGSFIAYQEESLASPPPPPPTSPPPLSLFITETLCENVSKFFTITTINLFENVDNFKSNLLLQKANSINNGIRRSLTHWELQRFIFEGYLHVPSIVNQETIKNCLRFLNYHLGVPGSLTPGGAQKGLGKLSGSISNSTEVRALLFESLQIVEDILGEGVVDITNPSAQIAFRFPEYNNKDNAKIIDTTHWHTDGLRKGQRHGFSLLLGICLNDVDEDFCGNLIVYPGSHILIHQSQVGNHGDIDKDRLRVLSRQQYGSHNDTNNAATDMDVIHNRLNITEGHHINEPLDLPSLEDPYQLKSKAGDIVLLHPDLAHEGGPNFSHEIRKMVYFRLKINTNENWDDVTKQHADDIFSDMKNKKLKSILKSLSSFNGKQNSLT